MVNPIKSSLPTLQDEQPIIHTLLYVEDNAANLSMVEQFLSRRADLTLLTATDSEKGVQLAHSYLPEVILMDMHLPGISGFDAITSARRFDNRTYSDHRPVVQRLSERNPEVPQSRILPVCY